MEGMKLIDNAFRLHSKSNRYIFNQLEEKNLGKVYSPTGAAGVKFRKFMKSMDINRRQYPIVHDFFYSAIG